jgi:hypothetical protein
MSHYSLLCPFDSDLAAVGLERDPFIATQGDPARQRWRAAGKEHHLGLESCDPDGGSHVIKIILRKHQQAEPVARANSKITYK